jgi:hypothetical protein
MAIFFDILTDFLTPYDIFGHTLGTAFGLTFVGREKSKVFLACWPWQ